MDLLSNWTTPLLLKSAIARLRNFAFWKDRPTYVPEGIYPDDMFIVSYPKSGNTWMRFLIGNYLTGNECSFENCHQITPNIHLNPDYCSEVQRPRFIKSHAPYRPQYPNVIYLVRDGRDVAVSYYHHCIRKGHVNPDTTFSSFLEDFNAGKVDQYGSWSQHVNSWLDQAERILVVKYEKLLEDAERQLKAVLEFSKVEINKAAVHSAVKASTFKNMRKQEESDRANIDRLEEDRQGTRFMRSGQQEEWRKYFDRDMHRGFVKNHRTALKRLGYLD